MPPELLNNSPIPSTAPEGMPAELAFLEGKGEDVSDLRAELETMLRREPAPAPMAPPLNQPLQADARLPIREDGTVIDRREPATTVPGQADPAPTVSQEQALDPYSPGGTKTPPGDIADSTAEAPEPGEVLLDAEGKVRDAKTGRYVPHSAMHQERLRRQALEVELSKKDELVARATERLNVLQEIMHGQELRTKEAEAPKPVAPEAPIDPEVDIFGWAKQQHARAEAAERRLAEIAEQSQKQYGEISTQNRYRQDITTFAGKTQDFFDAYKFVSNMRTEELKALGFTDERHIAAQLAAEERALVQKELAGGGSPAARLYALAKAKGFRPPAPPAPAPAPVAPPPPPPAPVHAQQPAPAPAFVPQPSQEGRDQVQRIQNGVNASATLSGAGGAPGEGLTVQQLAEMPDEAFEALVGKIGRKNLDRMLGGRS